MTTDEMVRWLREQAHDEGDTLNDIATQIQADDMVRRAVGELVKELTTHADAMSVAIKNICSAMDDELDHQIRNADEAAEAYDHFVEHC